MTETRSFLTSTGRNIYNFLVSIVPADGCTQMCSTTIFPVWQMITSVYGEDSLVQLS